MQSAPGKERGGGRERRRAGGRRWASSAAPAAPTSPAATHARAHVHDDLERRPRAEGLGAGLSAARARARAPADHGHGEVAGGGRHRLAAEVSGAAQLTSGAGRVPLASGWRVRREQLQGERIVQTFPFNQTPRVSSFKSPFIKKGQNGATARSCAKWRHFCLFFL